MPHGGAPYRGQHAIVTLKMFSCIDICAHLGEIKSYLYYQDTLLFSFFVIYFCIEFIIYPPMPSLYNVFYNYFSDYKHVFLVVILAAFFSLITFTVYNQMKTPLSSLPFHNVANADQRGVPIQIHFFYADWCPHCKTAKPEWEAFKSEFDGKTVNNQIVECIAHNCTNDNDPNVQLIMSDFNVSSFPHIVLMANNSPVEFDAKITKPALEQFVMTVTKDN